MTHLGPAIACLALWLSASAVARAEPISESIPAPAFSIELHGDVPFAHAELEDALLPRLRDASIEIRAAAHGATARVTAYDGSVNVQIGPRQRIVPLGERTGAAAARVVALVILDLAPGEGPALPIPLAPTPASSAGMDSDTSPETSPETSPGIGPETAADPDPSTAPARVPESVPKGAPVQPEAAAMHAPAREQRQWVTPMPSSPPPPPPEPPQAVAPAAPGPAPRLAARSAGSRPGMARAGAMSVRLSAFGGIVRGPESEDAGLFSAGADARAGLGAWRAGAGAAWVHLPATDRGQAELGLHALSLRLEAGRAFGNLELTAGGFVVPYRLRVGVDGGEPAPAFHERVLFGGGVAARAVAEIGRGFGLQATAGIDVFGRRVRVSTPDEVLASTPAVALSINVGLSWDVLP